MPVGGSTSQLKDSHTPTWEGVKFCTQDAVPMLSLRLTENVRIASLHRTESPSMPGVALAVSQLSGAMR